VIKLHTLLSLIKQIEAAPSTHSVILLLQDYSSFALNSCRGDRKVIASIYRVMVESLKAMKPQLMQNVQVMSQSEWILTNPNDYWISVINAGRKLSLDRVRATNESVQTAGHVISCLMHVGCLLGSEASVVATTADSLPLHELALEYLKLCEVPLPEIKVVEVDDIKLKVPTEGFDDPDLELMVLDSSADTSRKIKRAFCEPGNVNFNPPLLLTALLGFTEGPIVVSRKAEYGGDSEYSCIEKMRDDFADGKLHPGDVKPPLTKILNDFMDKARANWKNEPMKKSIDDVKNFLKNQQKQSK
jgi:tyrosyl-tRNA synthetase